MNSLLSIFGGFYITLKTFKLCNRIYPYLFPIKYASLHEYINNDSYILITGASDGIGLDLAIQFAKKNSNLIIHGRNIEKLI